MAPQTICGGQPRLRFVHLPTPLEPAPRLSDSLGIDLRIKREDLSGLCVGGNKSRLLEYALGSLARDGVDTLVAYAAPQSNKLRDIAAVAARAGMRAVLLMPDEAGARDLPPQGNRLLYEILGADVRVLPANLDRAGIMAAQEAVRDEAARAGRKAAILDRDLDYGVDATIAYVDAAEELHGQFAVAGLQPHAVFIAAGAGMTVAGLALGLKHLGSPVRVHGVCTSTPASVLAPEVARHAARAAERLGIATRLAAEDLTLDDNYVASGYGALTPPLVEVIRRFAREHGLIVDPVYNAKVARAIVDQAASGALPKGATVVYVNTGGSPATYSYGAELAGGVDASIHGGAGA